MANQKISQMPAAAALTGTELVEVVQSGVNVQTTASALAGAGGLVSGGLLSGAFFDYTSNTTLALLAGVSVNVVTGKSYALEAWVLCTTLNNATSGGIQLQFSPTGYTDLTSNFTAVGFDTAVTQSYGNMRAAGQVTFATLQKNGNVSWFKLSGQLNVVAPGGSIGVWAAQNTSNVNATRILQATITATRLN